ncbi:MAG: hypothetical protein OXQ94_05095 [Gemmatimonadota bacterium]|nr:hypothetical protein [Gemmatimonadota bacterium]
MFRSTVHTLLLTSFLLAAWGGQKEVSSQTPREWPEHSWKLLTAEEKERQMCLSGKLVRRMISGRWIAELKDPDFEKTNRRMELDLTAWVENGDQNAARALLKADEYRQAKLPVSYRQFLTWYLRRDSCLERGYVKKTESEEEIE